MTTEALVNEILDQLIKSRFHGAINISGVRFQLLYSLLRLFDLYESEPGTTIKFEGLEDLDKRLLWKGNVLFQVKSSIKSSQSWSWFEKERILDHFFEVYQIDPTTHFAVVTNFSFSGDLQKLTEFCGSDAKDIPDSLLPKLKNIAHRNRIDLLKLHSLLRQISFEIIDEPGIHTKLLSAMVQHYEIETGNAQLYLSSLVHCVIGWAAQRAEVSKSHLEIERLRVKDAIGLGTEDPALRDRLIELVTLQPKEEQNDYYEGKQAQLRHILAQLDAPRPQWQQAIQSALETTNVCVVRASSGQGKSTLLYRYIYEHFVPYAIYRLNICSQEQHIGQIVNYLRSRLILGLPLIVVIDNLDFPQRHWHRVVTELNGENIRFLVSTRVEDWYRHGLSIKGFSPFFVEPMLNLEEARTIFQYFQQKGKIAESIRSAEWAYEKVAEKGLLIEFVYLITHGRMLAERIEEQIRNIEEQKEDPAKLDTIRLVSAAQLYGARVGVTALLELVQFTGDAERTLRSLDGEYIEIRGTECLGLHLVRSEHITRSLHGFLTLEQTIQRLIARLDTENLAALVSIVFADQNLELDSLIDSLKKRCQGLSLPQVNGLLNALYLATESLFIQANRRIFDSFVQISGPSSLMLISGSTIPTGGFNIFENLSELSAFKDNPRFHLQKALAEQVQSREQLGTQAVAKAVLQHIVEHQSFETNLELTEIAQFSNWCDFFKTEAQNLTAFYLSDSWEEQFWQCGAEQKSTFLASLYQIDIERYTDFVSNNLTMLHNQFKEQFEVLSLTFENENEGTISIEFIVDEGNEREHPHEQALRRLRNLRQWFPSYALYCSQGLYSTTGNQMPSVDDTHKRMAGETLDKDLHSKQNAQYVRQVDEFYAQNSRFEWSNHWLQIRRRSLELVKEFIRLHERVYLKQQYNSSQLQKLYTELDDLHRNSPILPSVVEQLLGDKAQQIQGVLRSWQATMQAFQSQYLESLDATSSSDEKSDNVRLMRYNLRDAFEKLPEFQSAFDVISQLNPNDKKDEALAQEELQSYAQLVDIFDFIYSEQQFVRHHFATSRNLNIAVQLWRKSQHDSFIAELKRCLNPLEDIGMKFFYPIMRQQRGLLFDVYLGYEVINFEEQPTEVGVIAYYLAQAEFEHHFLYFVPIVQGHPLGNMVMTQFETLKKLVAGEDVNGKVFPLPVSSEAQRLLPDLDITPLPDMALVQQIGAIFAEIDLEQNKLYFARSRLKGGSEFDAKRLRRFGSTYLKATQAKLNRGSEILRMAREFDDLGTAQEEWNLLWSHADDLLQLVADIENVNEEFVTQPILKSSALDPFYFRYLNCKYRHYQELQ